MADLSLELIQKETKRIQKDNAQRLKIVKGLLKSLTDRIRAKKCDPITAYLLPGEFPYCRCGFYLLRLGTNICESCKTRDTDLAIRKGSS